MANVPRIEAIDADSAVAICCDVLAFIRVAARAAGNSELGMTEADAWHGWPRCCPTHLPKWNGGTHERGSSHPLAAHEPGAARAADMRRCARGQSASMI